MLNYFIMNDTIKLGSVLWSNKYKSNAYIIYTNLAGKGEASNDR